MRKRGSSSSNGIVVAMMVVGVAGVVVEVGVVVVGVLSLPLLLTFVRM